MVSGPAMLLRWLDIWSPVPAVGLKMVLRQDGHGVWLSKRPIADIEGAASVEVGILGQGNPVIAVSGVVVGRTLSIGRLRVYKSQKVCCRHFQCG